MLNTPSSTPTSNSGIRFPRLLLTGAGGNLGQELRPRLKAYCDVLRVSHRRDLGPAAAGEEVQTASLEDAEHMLSLLDGVSAVVHMGGVSTEQPWAPILAGNIVGMVNLYEAARLKGVKRIVFASSNHVTGFYRQDEVVNTRMPPKPDGFYGLSKAFGEDLAQLYWDRWGVETVSIRIGSSFPEPKDARMLITWLSYADLTELIRCALFAPNVGHTIVYGMSNNRDTWWNNAAAAHLGFVAKDSSEAFRAQAEAQPRPAAGDPAGQFQGGGFVTRGPFETLAAVSA